MKYVNLYQPQIIEYWLTLVEGVILDYIMKANSWAKVKVIEDKNFFQVNVWKIIDDLPMLGIKSKQSVRKHIAKLIDLWFLERELVANSPYYSPTEHMKEYYFAGGKVRESQGSLEVSTSIALERYNSNVNSNVNYKHITISVSQVKEKNKSLAKHLETLLSSLQGKTDLSDVGADDIISIRNWCHSDYKLPTVSTTKEDSIMIRSVKREWLSFKRTYTKEEFNLWLQNYLLNIKWRKQDWKENSYFNHRFTLYAFLKQANWIKKFMTL